MTGLGFRAYGVWASRVWGLGFRASRAYRSHGVEGLLLGFWV